MSVYWSRLAVSAAQQALADRPPDPATAATVAVLKVVLAALEQHRQMFAVVARLNRHRPWADDIAHRQLVRSDSRYARGLEAPADDIREMLAQLEGARVVG